MVVSGCDVWSLPDWLIVSPRKRNLLVITSSHGRSLKTLLEWFIASDVPFVHTSPLCRYPQWLVYVIWMSHRSRARMVNSFNNRLHTAMNTYRPFGSLLWLKLHPQHDLLLNNDIISRLSCKLETRVATRGEGDVVVTGVWLGQSIYWIVAQLKPQYSSNPCGGI